MSININEKKKELLNASMYLFSNKGYTTTSVQDIASYCNISKATIYKLFKSKEEILVEILMYFNNQMARVINEININLAFSPKEKFIEKIYAILTQFATKKDFTLTLIQNERVFKESIVSEAFNESKLLLLNTLKDSIIEYFDDSITPILWDLTYSLRGLIKEFSYIFIMKRVIEKDFRDVASYIVNSIIYIAKEHSKDEVLIPLDSIKTLCSKTNFQFDKEFLLSEWTNQINEIRHIIGNTFNLVENTELIESVNLLELEFNNERRPFLIDALLMYLSTFSALITQVNYLKKIWIKLK
ncbi:MAG: TetR/AcrR family transcriptional regulator [Sarcina sp.]